MIQYPVVRTITGANLTPHHEDRRAGAWSDGDFRADGRDFSPTRWEVAGVASGRRFSLAAASPTRKTSFLGAGSSKRPSQPSVSPSRDELASARNSALKAWVIEGLTERKQEDNK
jgi:hypothetical protein